MFYRFLIFIVLIATYLPGNIANAQPIIPRFESLNVNEGLSQSSVYAIRQDKFGFMWFGTADGLNRYDGEEMKVYKIQNSKLDIESNYIRGYLSEDEGGNIWFSNESGIYCYDHWADKINTIMVFEPELFGRSSLDGIMIRDSVYWMLNSVLGVVSYDLRSKAFKRYRNEVFDRKANKQPYKPNFDKDGNIWFSFFPSDGLYCFSTKSKLFQHYFPHQTYYGIWFGKGKHYFTGKGKIHIYDSSTKVLSDFVFEMGRDSIVSVAQLFEDRYGRLWGCSPGEGLVYYDPKTKLVRHFRHDNAKSKSLPINIVTCNYVDAQDNLWIGTDGGGVACLDLKPPRFNLFPLNEGDYPFLQDYFTKCFFEDAQKRIWVGMHNNGFSIVDPTTLSVKNYNHFGSEKLSIVGSVFQDKDKNMWIGHSGGFSIFDEKRNTLKTLKLSPKIPLNYMNIYVYDLIQLQNGDLMGATQWGLAWIRKTNGNYSVRTYYEIPDLGSQAISLCQDSLGTIWIASPTAGLLKVEMREGPTVVLKFFKGVNIRSIHADERDNKVLWLASAKGLIRFNTASKTYVVYSEKDGMANGYIYGILEDKEHNFWMSSNGGLIYFDRSKNIFQNFTVNDGLQSNEFNTGAYYRGTSGTFYFGGIKGFNWFTDLENEYKEVKTRPHVAITDIAINDVSFSKRELFRKQRLIELPYNKNKISFRLAALDFTRPKANRIEYKLEGWDEHWVLSHNKGVNYPNLTPGDYTFKVRAANPYGIWSNEETISIRINAPFWKRWWFYACLVFAFLSVAILVINLINKRKFQRRLQMLEQQRLVDQERNRISKDMHDEIGSGLTHIALMTELIQTQKRADEELRKDVGSISNSARKLVDSMSEIIWALNPHNETLENLLAYIREHALQYFEPFDIHFEISFPDKIPGLKMSNEQRRNLFLVSKEALNNALKHANATEVSFTVLYQKGKLQFSIKDNGGGFDTSKIRRAANGLQNMEKRMSDIGGSFEIKTSGLGTEVNYGFHL
jgi:signal transduction histidine kinase/ligand-binding sensor domain-containing protein